MKNYRLIILLLLCSFSVGVMAQQITNVSGTVQDNIEVLIGATVCEIDENHRIINAAVTDINGNFTMKITNPKNKISFSYVGCKSRVLPINRSVYNITLESKTIVQEVVIKANKR